MQNVEKDQQFKNLKAENNDLIALDREITNLQTKFEQLPISSDMTPTAQSEAAVINNNALAFDNSEVKQCANNANYSLPTTNESNSPAVNY